MIDFSIPAETTELRARVAKFIDELVLPYEEQVGTRPFADIVAELQKLARAAGLWCPFIPTEWGGMGLGHVANAVIQLEVGRTSLAAWAMNCMGPQDATMLTLLELGTDEQKEKYLRPLVNGELRVCFAMTEKAAGADATGMQTLAVQDGDEWVINGEKWFASGASRSDLVLLMAKTNPDAPRHRQFTTFLVELPSNGFEIVRDIPTLHDAIEPSWQGEFVTGHAEIRLTDVRVPSANIIGELGGGFESGQHRLGYGRIRHGMWSIARAQQAMDLAAGRVLSRSTFGQALADRQGVQWMLADCARDLYIARLMVLHIAYCMEQGIDISQENSMAKNFIADMLSKVVDTALQLHGSLGYTMDTPLAAWYAEARMQHLVDGPDEVHRWRVGKKVLAAFERHGTTASAAGGRLF
ncbi:MULTISPECIES: acyl-CoA dehydrogenase family protein [Rhodococcus]|uniref:Acyl-CoA dehydrogenase family protein n=1 Tax=Rhodococcus oxybenzonivorans TaxID=1990687 RepID=A0AAE5A6C4_9NOCA|nr:MULTISPECIES: acyl-CoA dehydrogenase family protein [Rhodococcus]MDV7240545.1 acyl-CoA dehydrogenase family protein [Rhodococcus oxybenzonivorans]MDV7265760.1 acyl-CoA dehydrogenase family protein [Rhodococcus oxybenzonivorans]MDV7272818.1 acyl-CoA dehydrogenase family protein [Rhodococcus oxybenzonivorans]MDV7333443.1 acyl-CoA dehydrogenase family protein [Rhodococcus oxybenzonivorans]MDV7342610.1 acyl-CoA dehydrogenase family protein [Rhodococcus oxybenzonivorans]